jgi:hypothetical protein
MAITVNTQSNANSIVNREQFFLTTDATSAARTLVQVGFKPRFVSVYALTGASAGAEWHWAENMAAGTAFQRVAGGTGSLLGSNGITVGSITATTGDLMLNVPNQKTGAAQANTVVSTTTSPANAEILADGSIMALGTTVAVASSTLLVIATA